MSELTAEQDHTIYYEMMAHPALFFHHLPRKIAVLGDAHNGILQEILKHKDITEVLQINSRNHVAYPDPRVKNVTENNNDWLKQMHANLLDILIVATHSSTEQFAQYFKLLHTDGVLVLQSESPFKLAVLKATQQCLQAIGFSDIRLLNFPEPHFAGGWRSIFIAKKLGMIRKIREKDIYNKSFTTHYYNLDVHKAALALPEFMRGDMSF